MACHCVTITAVADAALDCVSYRCGYTAEDQRQAWHAVVAGYCSCPCCTMQASESSIAVAYNHGNSAFAGVAVFARVCNEHKHAVARVLGLQRSWTTCDANITIYYCSLQVRRQEFSQASKQASCSSTCYHSIPTTNSTCMYLSSYQSNCTPAPMTEPPCCTLLTCV
eukprot:6754-Heterococcus_DN1.PRE.3